MPIDWRTPLILTHRWLGMAGCVLFVIWFASGVVMMYVRMPSLSLEERLAPSPVVDLSAARVPPANAAAGRGLSPDRLRVGMLGDRPVYRFLDGGRWATVFADNAELLQSLTREEAVGLARRFAPEHASTLTYDAYLTDTDQWTMAVRGLLPLHRLSLGDPSDSYVYLSDRTGEAVMKTTRAGRRWGYLGAVPHWIYLTPLRRRSALWAQSVIWLSIAGCLTCLSGLAWGVWCVWRNSRSPYAGLMLWHHYAGLIFGCVTFTWVFSGLLSMDPWSWSPDTSATRRQQEAAAGGRFSLSPLTLGRLREGTKALAGGSPPKEIDVVQFQGELYLAAEQRLVSVAAPERGAFAGFDRGAVAAAARTAMPDAAVQDEAWLESYDAYYYARHGEKPLPVLRVRYDDPRGTWLYLDPRRGEILRREERLSRLNRWLYHGLHSFDFPFLYYRRPLWDLVLIALSIGGIVLSTTTMLPAWRRLRRHARRIASFNASTHRY